MDKNFERMIATGAARRIHRPTSENARKRLRAIAGPVTAALRPIAVDEKRATRLAGSSTDGGKRIIGKA